MNYDFIRLEQEQGFEKELNDLLQADLVTNILYNAKLFTDDDKYKAFEEHNFKITEELTPDLYNLCFKVVDKLHFEESVDFFIINSSEMNAFAIPNISPKGSHKIVLNSTIIDKLTDDELKFVIGHEIGHLICKSYIIDRVMGFLYRERDPHLLIHNKYLFWKKLNELSADRFGLIACGNIEKAISGFIKLNTGFPKDVLKVNVNIFLERSKEILKTVHNERNSVFSSHPIDSLRVVALDIFSKSDNFTLFEQSDKNLELSKDNITIKAMNEVLENFYLMGTELDQVRLDFFATAGLMMAGADGNISDDEMMHIVSYLSAFTLFPMEYMNEIVQLDTEKIFKNSIKTLLDPQYNPRSIEEERDYMMGFLVRIALSDNILCKEELDLLYEIGEKELYLSQERIAFFISSELSYSFSPKVI